MEVGIVVVGEKKSVL